MAVIVLTDRCNLACQACCRPRRTGRVREAWSAAEVECALDQLQAVGCSFVGFTGGEPGLWSDGDLRVADLLVMAAQRGLSPMVVTNGYCFRDAHATASFFDRSCGSVSTELQVCISVDSWHAGTWREGRSPALEAVLQWRDAQSEPPPLALEIVSLWCLDGSRNLPRGGFTHYLARGVSLSYAPLCSRASPEALDRLAPRLCPSGRDKRTLGSYGDLLREARGLTWDEWLALDNEALVGPCQAGEVLTLDLDGQWWLCNDRAGESLRVAAAGELTSRAIEECLARNPVVAASKRDGLVPVLRRSAAGEGPVPPEIARRALRTAPPYGISGRAACGLCRALPDELFV